MTQSTSTSSPAKSVPVSLKTSIAKVDAKAIGVAAEGLLYNKV